MSHLAEHEKPPTNIAQVGMGWQIITGTIDLGLGIFDAIILVQEWLYQWGRKKSQELKEKEVKRRGRKSPPSAGLEKRSIFVTDEASVLASWE